MAAGSLMNTGSGRIDQLLRRMPDLHTMNLDGWVRFCPALGGQLGLSYKVVRFGRTTGCLQLAASLIRMPRYTARMSWPLDLLPASVLSGFSPPNCLFWIH